MVALLGAVCVQALLHPGVTAREATQQYGQHLAKIRPHSEIRKTGRCGLQISNYAYFTSLSWNTRRRIF